MKTFFSEKIFRFFEYLLTNIAIFAQIVRPNIRQKPNVHSAEPSVLFGFGRPLLVFGQRDFVNEWIMSDGILRLKGFFSTGF